MGFGAASLSTVSITALLSRWFEHHLIIAIAFAYATMGLGVMLFSPLVESLSEEFGWRQSYLMLALIGVIGLPMAWLLLRLRADHGNPVIHQRLAESGRSNPLESSVGVGDALRTFEFWGLAWVYFMTGVGSFTVLLQTPAFLVDMGYSTSFAAKIYGTIGLFAPAGIIGITVLSRRYGQTPMILLSYSLSFFGVLCLLGFERSPMMFLLVLFVLLYGGTLGCRASAISTLASMFQRSCLGPDLRSNYHC